MSAVVDYDHEMDAGWRFGCAQIREGRDSVDAVVVLMQSVRIGAVAIVFGGRGRLVI